MQNEILRLKRRRDELLHRACIREEQPKIMEEVRAINRRLHELQGRLDREPRPDR